MVYYCFCVPALLTISMLVTEKSKNKHSVKKSPADDRYVLQSFVYGLYVIVAAAAFFIRSAGSLSFRPSDCAAAAILLLFAAFFVFCRVRLSGKRARSGIPHRKRAASVLTTAALTAASGALFLALFFNVHFHDTVFLAFPSFLTAVLFFDACPSVKPFVFFSAA
ncbi:MAG: hypothetical protein K6C36_04545 [Clostridia bacterium]|nr:hypothetical protein [Clostridia bacterium]